jgi:hypothetical protein
MPSGGSGRSGGAGPAAGAGSQGGGGFGAIPPHKLILAVILAGSIIFCSLILLAGGIAIVREAAPQGYGGHAGLARLAIAVKHAIIHHLFHHK